MNIQGRANGTMEKMMESHGIRDATGARQRKRLIGQCHGKILSIFLKNHFGGGQWAWHANARARAEKSEDSLLE